MFLMVKSESSQMASDDVGCSVVLEEKPIAGLQELLDWTPAARVVSHKPSALVPRSECSVKPSKVFFCHDMMGGYVNDNAYDGNDCVTAYRFYHWHLIDIFNYFSHHFLTIPPFGWIDVAHRNGVEMFGTFIVEWESGFQVMQQLLLPETLDMVVSQMVFITEECGFDGWLINIECEIVPEQVPSLVEFVKRLSFLLGPGKVVWYDSVTCEGKLRWQDQLNTANKVFYDACGSIFLNYGWNLKRLEQSKLITNGKPESVYASVDCYGRGTIGGGGYNSRFALELIERIGDTSIALFAPGFPYERQADNPYMIQSANMLFWARIAGFLGAPRALSPPVKTCFDLARGEREYSDGAVVTVAAGEDDQQGGCKKKWSCLRRQHLFPHFWYDEPGSGRRSLIQEGIAWHGGTCLRLEVRGLTGASTTGMEFDLFRVGCSAGSRLEVRVVATAVTLDSAVTMYMRLAEDGVTRDAVTTGDVTGESASRLGLRAPRPGVELDEALCPTYLAPADWVSWRGRWDVLPVDSVATVTIGVRVACTAEETAKHAVQVVLIGSFELTQV